MEIEYLNFLLHVADLEFKKQKLCQTVYPGFVTNLTAKFNVNFDSTYYRCAFLYRYGTALIQFVTESFSVFLNSYSAIDELVSSWQEGNLCSFTTGPGLDYISLLLAFQKYSKVPVGFKDVSVVSKHGAWRNTVNQMSLVQKGFLIPSLSNIPNIKNVKVIQKDLFKQVPQKIVAESSLILMVKSLNLDAGQNVKDEEKIFNMLKEMVSALKDGATIFCLDTKPSIQMLGKVLACFPGKYIFKYDWISPRLPITYPPPADLFQNSLHLNLYQKNIFPVGGMRGSLIIWQKKNDFILYQSITSPFNAMTLNVLQTSAHLKDSNLSTCLPIFNDSNCLDASFSSSSSLCGKTNFKDTHEKASFAGNYNETCKTKAESSIEQNVILNKSVIMKNCDKNNSASISKFVSDFKNIKSDILSQTSSSPEFKAPKTKSKNPVFSKEDLSLTSDRYRTIHTATDDESSLLKQLMLKVEELATIMEKGVNATTPLKTYCSQCKYEQHNCCYHHQTYRCATAIKNLCLHRCCNKVPYKGNCFHEARQNIILTDSGSHKPCPCLKNYCSSHNLPCQFKH